MATLIVLALSNAATMILTAWLLHRQATGQSPLPSMPTSQPGVTVESDPDPVETKGRPIV